MNVSITTRHNRLECLLIKAVLIRLKAGLFFAEWPREIKLDTAGTAKLQFINDAFIAAKVINPENLKKIIF